MLRIPNWCRPLLLQAFQLSAGCRKDDREACRAHGDNTDVHVYAIIMTWRRAVATLPSFIVEKKNERTVEVYRILVSNNLQFYYNFFYYFLCLSAQILCRVLWSLSSVAPTYSFLKWVWVTVFLDHFPSNVRGFYRRLIWTVLDEEKQILMKCWLGYGGWAASLQQHHAWCVLPVRLGIPELIWTMLSVKSIVEICVSSIHVVVCEECDDGVLAI